MTYIFGMRNNNGLNIRTHRSNNIFLLGGKKGFVLRSETQLSILVIKYIRKRIFFAVAGGNNQRNI